MRVPLSGKSWSELEVAPYKTINQGEDSELYMPEVSTNRVFSTCVCEIEICFTFTLTF